MPRLQSTNLNSSPPLPHTHLHHKYTWFKALFGPHQSLLREGAPNCKRAMPFSRTAVTSLLASSTGKRQGNCWALPPAQRQEEEGWLYGTCSLFQRLALLKGWFCLVRERSMICLVWECEIFGTLSLDFPVLTEEERLFGGPGPRRGFQVPGLRAGFGLRHSNRTLYSGQSALLCLRVGHSTQPGLGRHTNDSEGSPRQSGSS